MTPVTLVFPDLNSRHSKQITLHELDVHQLFSNRFSSHELIYDTKLKSCLNSFHKHAIWNLTSILVITYSPPL